MTDTLIDGRLCRLDLGYVNAYLVDDGEVTLVDAGTPWAVDTLRAELADAGYGPADLDRVLLTHFDLDHAGGLSRLGADAPVHALEPDASFAEGTRKPPLGNHKGLLQRATGPLYTAPDRPIDRLQDGDEVGRFSAHHTPGHTPGHAVFLHHELPVALLGDLVRETAGRIETPPWFINYDTAENAASVRALADREPTFEAAAVGHGDPLAEGGDAALQALADQVR